MSLGKRAQVVGSIPTAPTITPDDSVALTLLGVQNRGRKQGILFPCCSQLQMQVDAFRCVTGGVRNRRRERKSVPGGSGSSWPLSDAWPRWGTPSRRSVSWMRRPTKNRVRASRLRPGLSPRTLARGYFLPAIPASQEFERLVREGIPVVESFPVQIEQ